jgi:hypothetical protein
MAAITPSDGTVYWPPGEADWMTVLLDAQKAEVPNEVSPI